MALEEGYEIVDGQPRLKRTPEELAALTANVTAANERYRRSTLLSTDPESDHYEPSAFAPGGSLYSPSGGRDFGYTGRGQARQRQLEQGDERLQLERAKAEAAESQKDRVYRLDADKFVSQESEKAGKLRRESDIHSQGADFLIAERGLDPGSDAYPAQIAALLKSRAYALEHPEVQKTLARNDAIRAKHLEIVSKGGAEEFSGPAQDAFHREINAHGSVERARAHALTVKAGEEEVGKLRAAGFIDPATDLDWGTEKDVDGVTDIPVARTKNENFITDPESPHYGEVNYSKLIARGQEKQGAVTKDKTAIKEHTVELEKAYGISPAQLRNPIKVKPGKIDDWSAEGNKDGVDKDGKPTTFGKFVEEEKLNGDKGDAIQVDVGSKVVVMPRKEYLRHLATAALDDPEASEKDKEQARKRLGK